MNKKVYSFLTLMLVSLATFCQDLSTRILFTAEVLGTNNTPVVNTEAKGVATFHLSEDRQTLHAMVTAANLADSIVLIEVGVGVDVASMTVLHSLDSTITGSTAQFTVTDSALTQILDGINEENAFINVYAANAPTTGTASGAINLETGFSFFCNLDTAQTVPLISGSTAIGSANFSLDKSQDTLSVKFIASRVGSPIESVILYRGAPGATGTPILDLTGTLVRGSAIDTLVAVPDSIKSNLSQYVRNNEVYINVTTELFPAGEMRGRAQFSTDYYFDIYADQAGLAVPPLFGTQAKCAGHAYLNATFDTLRYFLVYDEDSLSSDILTATFGINGVPSHTLSADTSVISGIWTSSDPQALNDLAITGIFQNNLTIDIATTSHASGEITGLSNRYFQDGYSIFMDTTQVVEDVTTTGLPLGSGFISVNPRGTHANYAFAWSGLSDAATEVTLNNAIPTESGPVLFQLNNNQGSSTGSLSAAEGYTLANTLALQADSGYINIATAVHTAGEIRGYINRDYQVPTSIINPNFTVRKTLLSVFPNPTAEKLTIILQKPGARFADISIHNLLGKEVKRIANHTILNGSIAVDVSDIPNGTYLLNVNNGKLGSSLFVKK